MDSALCALLIRRQTRILWIVPLLVFTATALMFVLLFFAYFPLAVILMFFWGCSIGYVVDRFELAFAPFALHSGYKLHRRTEVPNFTRNAKEMAAEFGYELEGIYEAKCILAVNQIGNEVQLAGQIESIELWDEPMIRGLIAHELAHCHFRDSNFVYYVFGLMSVPFFLLEIVKVYIYSFTNSNGRTSRLIQKLLSFEFLDPQILFKRSESRADLFAALYLGDTIPLQTAFCIFAVNESLLRRVPLMDELHRSLRSHPSLFERIELLQSLNHS